jgi:hypothetical protein
MFVFLFLEEQEEGSLWGPDECDGHGRGQHQEPGQEGNQQHGGQKQRQPHGKLAVIYSLINK